MCADLFPEDFLRGDCSIRVNGLGFDSDEIAACVARKGLLSIELDLAVGECRCAGCAADPQPPLSLEEIRELLGRAREEGARRCIFVDSEPVSHPGLREMIDLARGLGMEVEVFVSAGAIDASMARFLRQRETVVVIKGESSAAIVNLKEAGYCRESAPALSIAIEVSEQNISEIPAIWRRIIEEGIEPRVQIMTPRDGERKTRADRASESGAGDV